MCKLCGICVYTTIQGDVVCCEKMIAIGSVNITGSLVIKSCHRLVSMIKVTAKNIYISDCENLIQMCEVYSKTLYLRNNTRLITITDITTTDLCVIEGCKQIIRLYNKEKPEILYIFDCGNEMPHELFWNMGSTNIFLYKSD